MQRRPDLTSMYTFELVCIGSNVIGSNVIGSNVRRASHLEGLLILRLFVDLRKSWLNSDFITSSYIMKVNNGCCIIIWVTKKKCRNKTLVAPNSNDIHPNDDGTYLCTENVCMPYLNNLWMQVFNSWSAFHKVWRCDIVSHKHFFSQAV